MIIAYIGKPMHLKTLRTKCNASSNVLKMMNNKKCSLSTRTLLSVYRTIVRTELDYGSIIYRSASQTMLRILDPLHPVGVRLYAWVNHPYFSLSGGTSFNNSQTDPKTHLLLHLAKKTNPPEFLQIVSSRVT